MHKRILLAAAALAVVASGSAVTMMNANASDSAPKSGPVAVGPDARPGARPAGVKGEPVTAVASAPKTGAASAGAYPNCLGYAYAPYSEAGGIFGYAEVACNQVVATIKLSITVAGIVYVYAHAEDSLLNTAYISNTAAAICPGLDDRVATYISADIYTVDNLHLTLSAVSSTVPAC